MAIPPHDMDGPHCLSMEDAVTWVHAVMCGEDCPSGCERDWGKLAGTVLRQDVLPFAR